MSRIFRITLLSWIEEFKNYNKIFKNLKIKKRLMKYLNQKI